jgi:hypothetical protein
VILQAASRASEALAALSYSEMDMTYWLEQAEKEMKELG